MRLGFVYDIPPEPLNTARTRFVDAGAIRVGVEPRAIDDASLRVSYAADAELAAGLEAVLGGRAVADRGVSLHVCGADDGHEYLRFDCFDREPHYHYSHRVAPGAPVVNHWVPFDRAACGEMLPWALERIRSHLPEMLREARGAHLVPKLDPAALERALHEIERLARASGQSVATLEQQVRALLDREEIRELTARYAHGIALGDGATVASLFTDDAIFSTRLSDRAEGIPEVLRGREAISKFYATIRPGTALPCVHNHVIRLDGDQASGTCSLEVRMTLDGRSLTGSAYYEDRFRRERGSWRFSARRCTFFHLVPIQQGWALPADSTDARSR